MTIFQKVVLFVFCLANMFLVAISLEDNSRQFILIIVTVYLLYYLIFIHWIKDKPKQYKRITNTILSILWVAVVSAIVWYSISRYEDYTKDKQFWHIVDLVDDFYSWWSSGEKYKLDLVYWNFAKTNTCTEFIDPFWDKACPWVRNILMLSWNKLELIEAWNSDVECEYVEKYNIPSQIASECYDEDIRIMKQNYR